MLSFCRSTSVRNLDPSARAYLVDIALFDKWLVQSLLDHLKAKAGTSAEARFQAWDTQATSQAHQEAYKITPSMIVDKMLIALDGKQNVLGFEDLFVQWVDEGSSFIVQECDGYEKILFWDKIEWKEA